MMGYLNSFCDIFWLVSILNILNKQKWHNHNVIKHAQLSLRLKCAVLPVSVQPEAFMVEL